MAPLKTQEPRRAPPFKPPRRMDPDDESLTARAASVRNRSNATGRPSDSSPSSDIDLEDAESVEETAELDSTRRRRAASRLVPSTPRNLGQPGVQDLFQDDPNEHSISRALITRILVSGFQDKNTKIGKEALGIVEMYMRLFIKESIARTRQEAKNKDGASLDDDWLQVDDLEKIAPQLILDF